ncbi:MAG: aspartate aminotransferase family protein [Deltaproteobacteria bacterium CG11_big_fil_rev_8_21_14_0_20_45_16]|nr:MAG: aspartate aminotransferase family protein [Deltaproteobacteria bacterium CG11_big_fil_rev_8_21_14_0_20_45_16]
MPPARIESTDFSIRKVFENQYQRFENHSQYMNPQLPKVLKTLGFDKSYVRGEAQYLWDQDGKRYLDLLSGYGVYNLGRYHPVIVKTLREMLDLQDANLVQMDCPHLTGELAKEIIQRSPSGDRVYFTSTGAETVETAIKFAKATTRRDRIVSLKKAFHGLTVGALSVMGNEEFREGFGGLLSGCEQVAMNDLNALENELKKKDVAAFVFEPIQGKGVFIPEAGFLKAAEELCHKYGTLTIADEVQTGMGRTGKMFAIEYEGLKPDIILISKALSGGLVPTGAVIASDKIFKSVFSSMDRCVVHSSTFGKNSLSAAMGLATIWVLENEGLIEQANVIGEKLIAGLNAMKPEFEMLGEIRGRGAMIGIEFISPRSLSLKMGWNLLHTLDKSLFPQMIIIPLLRDFGILTQTSGKGQDIIKLLPPLVMSDDDIDYFLKSFRTVLELAHKFPGGLWDLGKSLAKASLSEKAS